MTPLETRRAFAIKSHQTVLNGQGAVDALLDYTYDALYHVTVATGREHPKLSGSEYANPKDSFKQSGFLR